MPIEINKLTHTYSQNGLSETKALKEISLTINEGEFIGIIGHTGSGKTTFVQHLNALLKPTTGNIVVDGIDTNKKEELLLIRKKVGLVFQYPENQLFEESIYKDIAFGPKNLGISKEKIDARVKEAMGLVALDFEKYANRSPFEISGGQMRRVAIAGVIAMHPKYLVLDEPTAGLDPHGRDKILNMILNLHKNNNITVIMVTHNMDDIAKLATRLILFNKGEVVGDNTPREIFKNPEQLRQIGLDIPQVSQLSHKLNEAGFDIPADIYKIDELKSNILRLFTNSKEEKC